MKTPPVYLLAAALAALLVSPTSAHADQPNMRAAAGFLQSAKNARDPMAHLRAAKDSLKQANNNKGGGRVNALAEVQEAINEARAGNRKRMIWRINRAIAWVHAGAEKARQAAY
ncbi:MAG TPA: hypothetical protein VF585_09235 [Chthoniobacterales bacterium]|jgi:hypothetical protein